MKQKFFRGKRATSFMEYMALLLFLMGALYIFQFYIVRAISGNWKKAGDAYGGGRQYDQRAFGAIGEGKGTLECFFENTHCEDPKFTTADIGQCVLLNKWVSTQCFRENCDCTQPPEQAAEYTAHCWNCLVNICSEDQFPLCKGD